jgi:hypothetical protein
LTLDGERVAIVEDPPDLARRPNLGNGVTMIGAASLGSRERSTHVVPLVLLHDPTRLS